MFMYSVLPFKIMVPKISKVLIIISAVINQFNKGNADIWCNCNNCIDGLPYCQGSTDTMCFEVTYENSSNIYGCTTFNKCFELEGQSFRCCNSSNWCNEAENQTLFDGNMQIATELEDNYEKMSCYCNRCPEFDSCVTEGYCYKQVTVSRDLPIVYGCVPHHLTNQLCKNYYTNDQPTVHGIGYYCCNDSKWCNANANSLNELNVSALRLRPIRLEKINVEYDYPMFRIIPINEGQTQIYTKLINLKTQSMYTATINDGKCYFEFPIDSWYKFEFTPLVQNIFMTKYMKSFYMIRQHQSSNLSWFSQKNFGNHSSTYILAVCARCWGEFTYNDCSYCIVYNEENTNPIWIPDTFYNDM